MGRFFFFTNTGIYTHKERGGNKNVCYAYVCVCSLEQNIEYSSEMLLLTEDEKYIVNKSSFFSI